MIKICLALGLVGAFWCYPVCAGDGESRRKGRNDLVSEPERSVDLKFGIQDLYHLQGRNWFPHVLSIAGNMDSYEHLRADFSVLCGASYVYTRHGHKRFQEHVETNFTVRRIGEVCDREKRFVLEDGTHFYGCNLFDFEFDSMSINTSNCVGLVVVLNIRVIINGIYGRTDLFASSGYSRVENDFSMIRGGGVSIIQLPDVGQKYIGLHLTHEHLVLYTYTPQGAVTPVRIPALEDENVRVVIPGMIGVNIKRNNDEGWLDLQPTTELGYDEEHGEWVIMSFNKPMKVNRDRQTHGHVEPWVLHYLTPVMWYRKIIPSEGGDGRFRLLAVME